MKAILAVLGSSVAIFWPGALTFGFPGVMAPVWQEMFHVGRGATGITIFFMLAAVGIFMFLVGRWQERYGTRKMIALGVILTSFASVVVAYASSISAVYAWAFLNGLASSFVYIPTLTLVQWWYPEKKGLVSGIVSMVFGLSAAIMSPLFGKMLVSLGYVSMNLSIAVLTLMIGLVGAYFARAPDSSEKPASNSVDDEPIFGKKASKLRETGEVTGEISNRAGVLAYTKFLVSLDNLDSSGSSRSLHDHPLDRIRTLQGLFPGIGNTPPDLIQPDQWSEPSHKRILLRQNRPKPHHEHGLPGFRSCLFHPSLGSQSGSVCLHCGSGGIFLRHSFFRLRSVGGRLLRPRALWSRIWADLCGLRLHRRADWPDA